MKLPSIEEIESLHKKYAPSEEVFELVYTHCKIVSEIASQLIERNSLPVDTELVRAGALLHDIGVYRLSTDKDFVLSDYIRHGVLGEELLRDEGVPTVLSRIASHHTGVGLTKEDITLQNLPLPLKDYIAESDEELLVMYADKFHSKTRPPRFNTFESYRRYVERFGANKVKIFEAMATKFGLPNLAKLSKTYGHALI